MSEVLEVWLDGDLSAPSQVGTLANDRGQIRFHYDRDSWQRHHHELRACWVSASSKCRQRKLLPMPLKRAARHTTCGVK